MLDKIAELFGGSIFTGIKDTVMSYLPPDLTPTQKAEIELKVQELLNQKQRDFDAAANEAQNMFNTRVKELEGTAADLKTLPILGPIVIFLRGVQRPAWGFYTMYLDYHWVISSFEFDEKQGLGLILINVLVLGFLFGERTIRNLQPLIEKVFAKQT